MKNEIIIKHFVVKNSYELYFLFLRFEKSVCYPIYLQHNTILYHIRVKSFKFRLNLEILYPEYIQENIES